MCKAQGSPCALYTSAPVPAPASALLTGLSWQRTSRAVSCSVAKQAASSTYDAVEVAVARSSGCCCSMLSTEPTAAPTLPAMTTLVEMRSCQPTTTGQRVFPQSTGIALGSGQAGGCRRSQAGQMSNPGALM